MQYTHITIYHLLLPKCCRIGFQFKWCKASSIICDRGRNVRHPEYQNFSVMHLRKVSIIRYIRIWLMVFVGQAPRPHFICSKQFLADLLPHDGVVFSALMGIFRKFSQRFAMVLYSVVYVYMVYTTRWGYRPRPSPFPEMRDALRVLANWVWGLKPHAALIIPSWRVMYSCGRCCCCLHCSACMLLRSVLR